MVWFNMEAIPKSDIKSDISFDISIKLTTWIGHKDKKEWKNYKFQNFLIFGHFGWIIFQSIQTLLTKRSSVKMALHIWNQNTKKVHLGLQFWGQQKMSACINKNRCIIFIKFEPRPLAWKVRALTTIPRRIVWMLKKHFITNIMYTIF